MDKLKGKEYLICQLVGEGWPNSKISIQIGVGEQVVKNYLRYVFAKAGITNRQALIIFMFKNGIVDCPCGSCGSTPRVRSTLRVLDKYLESVNHPSTSRYRVMIAEALKEKSRKISPCLYLDSSP